MPTYCYRLPDGSLIELPMTVAQMEALGPTPVIDGQRCTRDIVAEHAHVPATPGAWPLKSDAVGVHPSDAGRASEADAKGGVPTDYDHKTGQAIFRDRKHRAKWLKLHGYHDRSGGYGDG